MTRYLNLSVEDMEDLRAGASINVPDSEGFELVAIADQPEKKETGSLTLETARQNIGKAVAYIPRRGRAEDGIITSVNDSYVFVRYETDSSPKATRPEDLALLTR